MNSSLLEKFLVEMGKVLEQAKDFSMEQLPLSAKEILHYSIAIDCMWLAFGLILLGIDYIAFIYIRNAINKDYENDGREAIYLAPLLLSIPGLIVTFTSVADLLKVVFAPRVYLLEYISHILTK
jgi:hypothetical protein